MTEPMPLDIQGHLSLKRDERASKLLFYLFKVAGKKGAQWSKIPISTKKMCADLGFSRHIFEKARAKLIRLRLVTVAKKYAAYVDHGIPGIRCFYQLEHEAFQETKLTDAQSKIER